MSNDYYKGSLAQLYVSYSTSIASSSVVGENFYRPMIFLGKSLIAANLLTDPGLNKELTVTAANYSTVAQGNLLTWLTDFFGIATGATAFIVTFDDTEATAGVFPYDLLKAAFDLFYLDGYFKLMFNPADTAQLGLAQVCSTDSVCSQALIGSASASLLDAESTTDLVYLCKTASYAAAIAYHPSTTRNAWMVQLALSLGTINTSGTPMGNSLDYISTDAFTASGVSGANLTVAQVTVLNTKCVAYWLTTGDPSGKVVMHGGKVVTVDTNDKLAALWTARWLDFVAGVDTAVFISTNGAPRNGTTWNQILGLLKKRLSQLELSGRLGNSKITAPGFDPSLYITSTGGITIPNAWTATYYGVTRAVSVSGTLTIQ